MSNNTPIVYRIKSNLLNLAKTSIICLPATSFHLIPILPFTTVKLFLTGHLAFPHRHDFKIVLLWASLVVQWLRICLPMQGTQVQALVWEDSTCRGAAGPVSHNY